MAGSTAITSLTDTNVTTVALLNTYLGETDTTDAKTAAVNAAIGYVRAFCGRTFGSARYRGWYRLEGETKFLFEDRPITAINRLASGTQDALSVCLTNSTAKNATVSVLEDRLRIHTWDPTNAGLTEDALYADYPKVSDFVAGIAAATTLNTWTVSCLVDGDAYSLRPRTPQDVLNATIHLELPDDEVSVASVDEDAGIAYLGYRVRGWVYADYSAGYGNVPADLQQAATEIAAAILKSEPVNLNVQSERIGDYQYSVASGQAGETGILAGFTSRLEPYRKFRL